ncbi:hypothetical protein B0H14DRAFT_3475842 [Mycena olivaceomarginata]|nr:hypothetical protein B0H14DRAFT_3475842 [Mycena olivaceomarginata]
MSSPSSPLPIPFFPCPHSTIPLYKGCCPSATTPLFATRARTAPAPSTSLPIASTRNLPRLPSLLRSSSASDSLATTHTARHRPCALYDIPVPHPALCTPSRSLHPHPGVADSILVHALDPAPSRIGRNSYLHTLPPHPFFRPAFLPLSTIPVRRATPSTTRMTTGHRHT